MNNDSETYQLYAVGTNFESSKIIYREMFHIDKNQLKLSLSYFYNREEVEGIVIVITCNRIEYYISTNKPVDALQIVEDFYGETKNITQLKKLDTFYVYDNSNAVAHLFKVITGLDSMLLGEYQVQGQIKDYYSRACSEKAVDKILHKLFHAAFRTGKKIRTETKIGSGNQSLSGIALKKLKQTIGKDEVITIIGVNENTKIFTEGLKQSGYKNINFVNRTEYKAKELASRYGGEFYGLYYIDDLLKKSNCVFSCTGASGTVISAQKINYAYKQSSNLRLVIDMAVPRDIEREGIDEGIELIVLDNIKNILSDQNKLIENEIPAAESIIASEVSLFEAWNDSQENEAYNYYSQKLEKVRIDLLNEYKHKLSEEAYGIVDTFSHSLIHKVKSNLHQLITTNHVTSCKEKRKQSIAEPKNINGIKL